MNAFQVHSYREGRGGEGREGEGREGKGRGGEGRGGEGKGGEGREGKKIRERGCTERVKRAGRGGAEKRKKGIFTIDREQLCFCL